MGTDYLSLDNFYPDHPSCASDGSLTTTRNPLKPRETEPWHCLNCETSFHTPPDSVWNDIDELPEDQRRAYKHVVIRGLSTREASRFLGVGSAHSVGMLVNYAKKTLNQPTETEGTEASEVTVHAD